MPFFKQEFHKIFRLDPKQLGLTVTTWPDEYGVDVKGIFARPSAEHPPAGCRRVALWYETKWTQQDDRIPAAKRIRSRQLEEAFDTTVTEETKKRPKDRCISFFADLGTSKCAIYGC